MTKNTKPTKKELATKLCQEFPAATSMGLARILRKRYPAIFLNVKSGYDAVCHARGSRGKRARRQATVPGGSPFRRKTKKVIPKIPDPVVYDSTPKYVYLDSHKVLVLCDIHAPFHDKEALEAALTYGELMNVDTIIVNGDLLDFIGISSFVRTNRDVSLPEELTAARQILTHIRARFPKSKIYYKLGNHEDRLEKYLAIHAPELLGLENVSISALLRLDELDVKLVDSRSIIRLGALHVIHGHEFRSGFSNPVNPARNLYLKSKANVLCGHWHQSAKHTEKDIAESVKACWSIGCLCDMRPTYAPLNNWNHGFAIVTVIGDKFVVQNHEIIDGRVF